MNSKEISQKSQLPISTIRYYEKINLIPMPPRKANGYRDYDEDTLYLLSIIRGLTDLGFSLKEIKGIFDLIQSKINTTDAMVNIQTIFEQKEYKIAHKMNSLKLVKKNIVNILQKRFYANDFKVQDTVEKIANIFSEK